MSPSAQGRREWLTGVEETLGLHGESFASHILLPRVLTSPDSVSLPSVFLGISNKFLSFFFLFCSVTVSYIPRTRSSAAPALSLPLSFSVPLLYRSLPHTHEFLFCLCPMEFGLDSECDSAFRAYPLSLGGSPVGNGCPRTCW